MTQILIRRGTAATWTSNNPVLGLGEIGYETDTKKAKMGDGSTTWNSLGYWIPTLPTGDVVGTTDAQAITNKDLSSTVNPNTFPTRLQRQVTTITSPTTLGNTYGEHVTLCSYASTDTSFADVAMLLHCNGTNNSTTFTDSSLGQWTNYSQGAAKISTAQSKFGGASAVFDGSTSYVTLNTPTSMMNYGTTGDFTIEAWVYTSSQALNYSSILATNSAYGDQSFYLMNLGTGVAGAARKIRASLFHGGAGAGVDSTTLLNTNTWYHVAVTRTSGTLRLFINGTLEGSAANATYPANFGNTGLNLGRNGWDGAAGYWNGYIDEVRITKSSRYTASFTAPTAAFPDATIGTPTLPTAVGNTSSYVLKNTLPTTSNAVTVTVNTTSSQTIDGSTTLSLPVGASVRLDSDGSNWRAAYNDKILAGKTLTSPTIPDQANVGGLGDANGVSFLSTGVGGIVLYMNNASGSNISKTPFYMQNMDTTGNVQTSVFHRTASAGGYLVFIGTGGTTGGIGTTNGTTTYYNTSSDYRLKENVIDFTGGLDSIGALRPVRYDWKHDGSYGEGFIAHELQAVVPEAVVGEKDAVDESGEIVPQGVDPGKLVVHLVSAVQELTTRLEAAEAEITRLKGGTP